MLRLIVIVLAVLGSGCASITTGQDQIVSVQTPNCLNVSCELQNKEGTYYVDRTPGTVTVNRKCSEMLVSCQADGEPEFVMSVKASVKAMTFGNILFGGLIGAGVDAATGAACEYPAVIPVPMNCKGELALVEFESADDIPKAVAKAAEKLDCTQPAEVGDGPDGKRVYAAVCDGEDALLSCDERKCAMSKFTVINQAVTAE